MAASQSIIPCSKAPEIHLPGHSPLIPNLTPSELYTLFPKLHTYLMSDTLVLPENTLTHRGLSTALQWQTCERDDPSYPGLNVSIEELVELHQAFSILGNPPKGPLMQMLRGIIKETINEGLTLSEMRGIWGLRALKGTKPWVDMVVKGLVGFTRRSLEVFKDEGVQERLRRGGVQARKELERRVEVLKWVWGDKELFIRVERAAEEDVGGVEMELGTKKGRNLEMSAVRGFRCGLEVIEEEGEDVGVM